jgi:hypothetical protein
MLSECCCSFKLFFIFIIISGVGLSLLGTAATFGLLYKPQMIDEDDCGAIGGMKIGRGSRSTRRKPSPAPLCPPQIRRRGKPATNRLRYGAALASLFLRLPMVLQAKFPLGLAMLYNVDY